MGRLIVVTGPPGSGKSTVAEVLAQAFDPSALVAGDFFNCPRRGAIAQWQPGSRAQNDEVLAGSGAAAGRLSAGRLTVVFEGVLGPWLLPRFVAATGLASIDYVLLLPSEARIEQQVRDGVGHGFRDLDATRHMHREFAAAEIDARHVLTDPPHDPHETAALIRHRLAGGVLRWALPADLDIRRAPCRATGI